MPKRGGTRSRTRKARRRPSVRPSGGDDTGGVSLAQAKRIAATRRGVRPKAKAALADASVADVAASRRRLALRQRADLKERIRLYDETYEIMRRRGVKGLPGPARRAGAKAPPAPLRIFAEGDSWFEYPYPLFGGGLVPRLERRLGLPILATAEPGDEVRFMLGVRQREKLIALLQRGIDRNAPWDLLLFSGGGNDIVSDPLCLWLKPWKSGLPPGKLIDGPRFDAVLAIVRAGYEDLIAIRDRISPKTRLLLHGYDFALPTGKGVCHLGPWLKPSFDHHHFPDEKSGAAVVREMLLRFRKLLASLAKAHPDVAIVDTQGTLDAHPGWWHNELHPNQQGFDQFVALFLAKLRQLYPGRIP